MVERVNLAKVESYGIVDLNGKDPKPFQSIPISGIVEKPECEIAPSNLAALGCCITFKSI